MSYYLDQINKINYYKQKIIEELSSSGIFPNNILIQNKIDDIDTKLAIFQYISVSETDVFDVDKFNEDLLRIYNDLLILYSLTYKMSVTEYENIKSYAETHLLELEDLARMYEYKTKEELDSTSLGNTVFFQSNGFNITYNNGIAIIDLGKITLHNASKVACIFKAENVSSEQVVFNFDDKYNCSPYDYNKDFFIVPGDIDKNTYFYTLPENCNKVSLYEMSLENFVPDKNNKYVIYGGKNCISSILGNNKTFYKKTIDIGLTLTGAGKIVFYVLNSSYIEFDFSTKPISTNFNNNCIDNPEKEQKIVIEYYGSFSFNFFTDGVIYATKENGIITDNKLYYPNADDINSFYILEYLNTKTTDYNNVKVIISDLLDDNLLTINTIALKELNVLDEV